jgi:hypothetical protein
VEVADLGDAIALRDSKHPAESALTFSRAEWHTFVAGVQAGEFTFD